MTLWQFRFLIAAAVAVGTIPTDAPALSVVMTFAAVALGLVAIERAYRHALQLLERDRDLWRARHRQEHENFQRWIRRQRRSD